MVTKDRFKSYIYATTSVTVVMALLLFVHTVFDLEFAEYLLYPGMFLICYLSYRSHQQHGLLQAKQQTANQTRITLEQRNALLATAIESTHAGIVIADATQPGHPIIFVNKSFTIITGYTAEEALGRDCLFLQGTHTSKDAMVDIKTAMNGYIPIELDVLNYRKNQSLFWNNLRISPLFDDDGTIKNFIALQNDITEMHNTQQALTIAKEEAERSTNVKSNFMAMMSHEIRTPINGVLGTLSLLNDSVQSDEAKHLSSVAYDSAEALLVIVNDMLDFSKIEAGKLSIESLNFSLQDVINSSIAVMQPIAQRKNIPLYLEYDSTLPRMVRGDPTRIKQILLNLISNAIKFTEQGSVTIKASNLLAVTNDNNSQCILRVEVIDTGIGMTPDGVTQIFTEFNQLDPSIARRYGGTGLGLAICRRLIMLMDGEIEVESRSGFGSKFWFVLPLQIVNIAEPQIKHPAQRATQNNGGSILVVEDNPTNQLVLTKMLERAGYHCAIAANGAIALEKIVLSEYDLVFMDVSMPVMDGLTATRHIRALGGNYVTLPIIAMTAQTMQGDRERCLKAGMDDYLSKPIDREGLLQTTSKWIAARPQQDFVAAINNPQQEAAEITATDTAQNDTINWPILKQLAADVGVDTIDRILGVFELDIEQRALIFRQALDAQDWENMQREAHTIKSCSASCGLLALSENMRTIEASLHHGDSATACLHAATFDQLVQAAQSAIKDARQFYQKENRL